MGAGQSAVNTANNNNITNASILRNDLATDGVISYTHFNGWDQSAITFMSSGGTPATQFRLDTVKNIQS